MTPTSPTEYSLKREDLVREWDDVPTKPLAESDVAAMRANRPRFFSLDAAGFRLQLEVAPGDGRTDVEIMMDLRDALNDELVGAALRDLQQSVTRWPDDIAAESKKEDVQF